MMIPVIFAVLVRMGQDESIFVTAKNSSEAKKAPLCGVFDSYIRYYASGKSHTARAKRLDLEHFVNYLLFDKGYSKSEKLKVEDFSPSSVKHFVDHCLDQGQAPATVARRLATLKHMGRTLAERVPGFINPAREVKAPKVMPPKPKALSPKEVDHAKSRAKSRVKEKTSFIRVRNETLFALLIDTGLRADEVRLLRLSQLDEDLCWIKNVRTKGRQFRNVYITSSMRPELQAYLTLREKELRRFYSKLPRSENRALPVFISNYNATPGAPDTFLMGAKSIWRAINELSTDTGTPLHPHLLRHSYATELIDSSKDVRLVSQALGHSDVRITMRYTERKEEEIAKALEKTRNGG